MLKIGVIGAGHLGKIHLKCIKEIMEYQLVGFYDTDKKNAQSIVNEFNIRNFNSIDALIDEVDVVDIVTPTNAHFESAARSLGKFRHVFIEKPIVSTPGEALKLMEIAEETGVKVQVGHVERFNPALLAAMPFIHNPLFIEINRLAEFKHRGSDVPVILDLMIHDIDIVLHLVKANLRKISANGIRLMSSSMDFANARLEFDNGCVANLTASRISASPIRKAKFFHHDRYVSVDFLNKKTEVFKAKGATIAGANLLLPNFEPKTGVESQQLLREEPEIKPTNAIQAELASFAISILQNTAPAVTILDGYEALKVAHLILEKAENQSKPANPLTLDRVGSYNSKAGQINRG